MGKKRKNKKKKKNTTHQFGSMKPVFNRISTTEEFTSFVNELFYQFETQWDTVFISNKEDKISTRCPIRRVNEIYYTETFRVLNESFHLQITPLYDGVHLHILEVSTTNRKKGIGSSIMKILRLISNNLNIPIYLIPIPMNEDIVSYEVIQSFYKKHGYKREKTSRYWKYEPNSISTDYREYYSLAS